MFPNVVMTYDNSSFSFNETERRFEMTANHQTAFIEYKQGGKKIYLIHTEVSESLQDKGMAAALVEKTLIFINDHHWQMVPLCSYVQHYINKHPVWNKLVVTED